MSQCALQISTRGPIPVACWDMTRESMVKNTAMWQRSCSTAACRSITTVHSGERMWCTCVRTVRSIAAIATLGSRTAPHHMAPPDVLTGRSAHARLRREVPVDHEARRQAAMAAAESRSALCSKELRREDAPEAEAGRRLPQQWC